VLTEIWRQYQINRARERKKIDLEKVLKEEEKKGSSKRRFSHVSSTLGRRL
jgi:hypothetical protein